MWLVYLRFDGKNQTKITYVLCSNQKHAIQIVENARQFGLNQETPLVEYKLFYSHATIK